MDPADRIIPHRQASAWLDGIAEALAASRDLARLLDGDVAHRLQLARIRIRIDAATREVERLRNALRIR